MGKITCLGLASELVNTAEALRMLHDPQPGQSAYDWSVCYGSIMRINSNIFIAAEQGNLSLALETNGTCDLIAELTRIVVQCLDGIEGEIEISATKVSKQIMQLAYFLHFLHNEYLDVEE